MSEDRIILISNDDGIDAAGLAALTDSMHGLGTRYVVAPATEQSAVGHAITVRNPVRAHRTSFELASGPVVAYSVTGTPADCVKLAISQLLPRPPDLVVSGINRGPNTAVNVIYSGTVSAATEATILGIDAVAFSLCAWEGGDYQPAARYARMIAEKVLREGLPPGVLLNVNIPALSYDKILGVEVTRQARSRWEESFSERVDPSNQPYYWLSGRFVNLDEGEDTDVGAIEKGFVSVTPVHYDMTAHEYLVQFREWKWREREGY